MRVKHYALGILHICVVLESSSIHANSFAHLCNCSLVKVREEVQLEDSFGNLGRLHQVDFEQFSLQMTLIWAISLEHFQQEFGGFLDLAIFKVYLQDALNGVLWGALSISFSHHKGKRFGSSGIAGHNSPQNLQKVRFVASLLTVRQNFVKLVCLNQALHNLILRSRSLKDLQRHLRVVLSEKVSKFVALGELALVHPVLNEVHLARLEHRSCQLQRLRLVEFGARFEQGREVEHDWFLLASCGLHLLELVDSFLGSEEVRWRISRNSSRSCKISLRQAHVELLHEGFVSAAEPETRSELKGDGLVIWDVLSAHNILYKVVSVDINGDHLSGLVNANHAISVVVSGGSDDELISDSLSINERAL